MSASDISRITYELIRLHEDRLRMTHEDELQYLYNKINKLTNIKDNRKKQLIILNKKYDDLCSKYDVVMSSSSENKIIDELSPDLLSPEIRNVVDTKVNTNSNNNIITINNIINNSNSTKRISNNIDNQNKLKRHLSYPNHNTSTSSNNISRLSVDKPVNKIIKCVDVSRKPSDRAQLPGYTCEECEKFYNLLLKKDLIDNNDKNNYLNECSRHRYKYKPIETPDSYWNIELYTPDKLK